jgi:hypothetical protein
MCRYAFHTYKPHYACFDCRKTFKRKLLNPAIHGKEQVHPSRCPQCTNVMADMGLDFKAPPMKDVKAWEHLRRLFIGGFTWHSCGCYGPGYIPATQEVLLNHLHGLRASYLNQLGLSEKKIPKDDAPAYWRQRILEIEQRLATLKALD